MTDPAPADEPARKPWIRPAAYGVIERDGCLLLCRLSPVERNVGKWTLPGGGLDFGEKPDAGMCREVFEETGLRVTSHALLAVDANLYHLPDVDMYAIQIYYRAGVEDAPLRHEADGTTDVCAWVPLAEIPALPHVSIVDFALTQITS